MKTIIYLVIYTSLFGGDATLKVEIPSMGKCVRLLDQVYVHWPEPLYNAGRIAVKQVDI